MLCSGCGEMNNQFVCCGGLIKVKCACGKCRRHWIWGCQYSATTAATRVRRGIFRACAVDGLVVHVVHVLCVQPRPSPPARPAPPATCPSPRDARTPPPQPFCVRSRSFSPSTSAVSHAPNAVSGRIPSFHLCSPFCGTSRLATPTFQPFAAENSPASRHKPRLRTSTSTGSAQAGKERKNVVCRSRTLWVHKNGTNRAELSLLPLCGTVARLVTFSRLFSRPFLSTAGHTG